MDKGFRLSVYRADRRTKTGERLVNSYDYRDFTEQFMEQEVELLRQTKYRPAAGWRLEFEPMTVWVRSLMTGVLVEIDWRDRGTVCDPSMERYWST